MNIEKIFNTVMDSVSSAVTSNSMNQNMEKNYRQGKISDEDYDNYLNTIEAGERWKEMRNNE